ncbi:MAG: hypothetical protein AAF648_10160 [Pseudomonadota bacterium]
MTVPQRIVGPSVRSVMAQARRTLGPDALIIEHRRVNGQVELIALPVQQEAAQEQDSAHASAPPVAGTDSLVADELYQTEVDESPISVREASVSDAVEGPHSVQPERPPLGSPPRAAPQQADLFGSDVFSTLSGLGFTSSLLGRLSDHALTPRLAIQELCDATRRSDWRALGSLVPVLGPSGAGVTQCLLRVLLETEAAVQRRLRLGTLGPATGGRTDDLLRASELMRVPWAALSDDEALTVADALTPIDLMFLDLGGEVDASLLGLLQALLERSSRQSVVLVLPAHWRADVLDRWLSPLLPWLRRCADVHVLISHFDRCEAVERLLELVWLNHWRLSFFSSGPGLGAPFIPVDPVQLRKHLIRRMESLDPLTMVNHEPLFAGEEAPCMPYA